MSGYFSTYGPRWLNPTQLVWPFCREASCLCSWLKGRVVRDGASCECCGLQSCKGSLQGSGRRRRTEPPCRRGQGSLRDILCRGGDVLGRVNSKGPLNSPRHFVLRFLPFSLPSPSLLLSFFRLDVSVPRVPPAATRHTGWKGSAPWQEEERFPSLPRSGWLLRALPGAGRRLGCPGHPSKGHGDRPPPEAPTAPLGRAASLRFLSSSSWAA